VRAVLALSRINTEVPVAVVFLLRHPAARVGPFRERNHEHRHHPRHNRLLQS